MEEKLINNNFVDLIKNKEYNLDNDELNFLSIYRDKKLTKTVYYGIMWYECYFFALTKKTNIKSFFKERHIFRLEDTLTGVYLYWRGKKIKQISKKNGYYNIFDEGIQFLQLKNEKNISAEYKNYILPQIFFSKIEEDKIMDYHYYCSYPKKIDGENYLSYKFIDTKAISSLNNFVYNDCKGNRIYEIMQLNNNIFAIGYKSPFTFLYSFIIGSSLIRC